MLPCHRSDTRISLSSISLHRALVQLCLVVLKYLTLLYSVGLAFLCVLCCQRQTIAVLVWLIGLWKCYNVMGNCRNGWFRPPLTKISVMEFKKEWRVTKPHWPHKTPGQHSSSSGRLGGDVCLFPFPLLNFMKQLGRIVRERVIWRQNNEGLSFPFIFQKRRNWRQEDAQVKVAVWKD